MSSDKRSATRHSVSLPATVTIDGQTHSTLVQNLSLGGAFIAFDERLPMGKRVDISFSIPTQEQPVEVAAEVRWVGATGAGIQFDGLRARDVWSLNKYFENLL